MSKIFPLNEPPKRERKNIELDEQEFDWLEEFFNRSNVTYTTPGKKDQIYIGKVEGEKKKFSSKISTFFGPWMSFSIL